MARIELDLAHSYQRHPHSEADYALLPLQITFEDGGAYALLGPSGCGKTTMLNIISGLVTPSRGHVRFDGRDRTHDSPQARNIAQVFQFPVIYDTMTVGENLAFPLRNRRMPSDQIRQRVHHIAGLLELTGQLNQRAANLPADAKQKISLGRGLVRPDVSAVLFDEPLTVIDPQLKWELRRKLKQIHQELGLTLIYVTHDQIEAMTFADSVLVMARGRVVQQGSPAELFERPRHTFVGHFIGSPGMNLVPVHVHPDGTLQLQGQGHGQGHGQVQGPSLAHTDGRRLPEGPLTLGLRPEYLRFAAEPQPGSVAAEVTRVRHMGISQLLSAVAGGHEFKAYLPADAAAPAPGARVHLVLLDAHTCFYQNEELIS